MSTEDIDIAILKKKSIAGIVALTSRTFVLQIIAFGATFLLTIFLSPSIFGIFYVVSAIIAFLGYFSDIGLAAALIQKKETLTDEDLKTTFTIQQLLVGTTVIIAILLSSLLAGFYRLDNSGLWLMRALIIAFFLSSLKTIPSVILERDLNFHKLVIPQITETLGFYLVAVLLAWRGLGVASFTWAVITRAVVGLVSIYIISPWKIRIGLSIPTAKHLLHFGIPFQLNSFLALIKDDLLIVFLGKVLPFAEVGYIGWAKKWAEVPLRLIMDSIIRVTFPAFSRLQHEPKILGAAIEKTLFGLSLTIFPITVGLLFFMAPFVSFIPKYQKWEPALLSFYLFAIASAIAALSTPLTNALNAVGKIKTTLWLMVLWTTSTWLLTVIFIYLFGFNGVSLALLLITSTLWLVISLVKRISSFSFFHSIRTPLVGSIAQGLFYFLLLKLMIRSPIFLASGAVSGVILYVLLLWRFESDRTKDLVKLFLPFFIWKR